MLKNLLFPLRGRDQQPVTLPCQWSRSTLTCSRTLYTGDLASTMPFARSSRGITFSDAVLPTFRPLRTSARRFARSPSWTSSPARDQEPATAVNAEIQLHFHRAATAISRCRSSLKRDAPAPASRPPQLQCSSPCSTPAWSIHTLGAQRAYVFGSQEGRPYI